ncbi:hypothetical protein SDJN03_22545, partial [Cucurbita argyrosperma subsp. sororia]
MEIELEPRVKPLDYKVKGVSRESPSQKAANVLDSDLRTHWSTATNTKEWILLELDEPCLLSHIRIYNKSVLEWEIAAGLRYKPETFVKVRSRCEAPRRDMIYPMNYTPCRYVKISCLRGNPIAVFFVQMIGVPVAGLEPEFQPVVNHLLPHIVSHRQDGDDMHLQLLQDMTVRLSPFLPQLETDLVGFSDAPDLNLRFLAMLAGPSIQYYILAASKSIGNGTETEVSKNYQMSSPLTVSSNFEPRKSRSILPVVPSSSSCVVFRPDAIFMLLRMAYKDSTFGAICRVASRILLKIVATLSSPLYHPLLHACAGYLSSFSQSHAKAGCVLIDLCSSVLAPWMPRVIAKVDLVIELLEDLLGVIQNARQSLDQARAALKYILLALSGYFDDILGSYKNSNGGVAQLLLACFFQFCIHTCSCLLKSTFGSPLLPNLSTQIFLLQELNAVNDCDGKIDDHDTPGQSDVYEDAIPFFVAPELRCESLDNHSSRLNEGSLISSHGNVNIEPIEGVQGTNPDRFRGELVLDFGTNIEYFNLEADYFQLVNYRDCEVKASEFRRLALDLSSQNELTSEGHDASIDALLLAAECYVNPYFMMSCKYSPNHMKGMKSNEATVSKSSPTSELIKLAGKSKADLETIAHLERKRDKVVLQILLEAAELDRKYHLNLSDSESCPYNGEGLDEKMIMLSSNDVQSVDAVTLVRQNQALLWTFVIRLLQRKPNSMHEILMQSLLFLLRSATKLHCRPEDVIDIILSSAEFLNGLLTSLYYQIKDGNSQLEPGTIHGTQRHWILLQKLVHASSGGNYRTDFTSTSSANNSFCSGNLIPASAWMQRISNFQLANFLWSFPRLDGGIPKCKTVYNGPSFSCIRFITVNKFVAYIF